MSRSLPCSMLYFVVKCDYDRVNKYLAHYNVLLEKGGNMLLLAPVKATKDVYNDKRFIIVFPLYFHFPFVIFPLYYIPRVLYTFSIMIASWKNGVKIRPVRSRYALAVILNGGAER